MKKTILTFVAMTLSFSAAQAADMYCGANRESTPGTQVYDKNLYWEKVDMTKSYIRILTAEGDLVKIEELSPEQLAKVPNSTLAFGTSFNDGRPNLFIGRVKRKGPQEIQFKQLALAGSMDGKGSFLMSHGIALTCKEM